MSAGAGGSRARRTRERWGRALLAAVLLALAAVAGGCGRSADRTLVVLGTWEQEEAAAFEATLAELEKGSGYDYEYQGTRSLRGTLVGQLEAGTPPDVAVLSSVGELTEYAYAEVLRPLDDELEARAFEPWVPELTIGGRQGVYWVPLKVDLKSLVWSREPPVGEPRSWCLGMSSDATTGWPGTDWIEDILLQRHGPEAYARWATGRLRWDARPVKDAWETWAGMIRDPQHRPTVRQALNLTFNDPGGKGLLFAEPACTDDHQGSFMRTYYEAAGYGVGDSAARIPGDEHTEGAYEVSGDLAAVFRPSAGATELVEQLSSEKGRRIWREQAERVAAKPELGQGWAPFFPSAADPQPVSDTGRRLAGVLTDSAEVLCYDASDAMPPSLRDAFHRAVLEFLALLEKPEPDLRPGLDSLLAQLQHEQALLQRGRGAAEGHWPERTAVCQGPAG